MMRCAFVHSNNILGKDSGREIERERPAQESSQDETYIGSGGCLTPSESDNGMNFLILYRAENM